MRIGALAQRTGVDVQTIRYYESEGLLPSPTREENGYRAYGSEHLERLAFIRHCRALDMPLADVKRLLDFVARPEADCGDVNVLIDEQLARVRARLASMRALDRECGILEELVSAAHGEACACHGRESTGMLEQRSAAELEATQRPWQSPITQAAPRRR